MENSRSGAEQRVMRWMMDRAALLSRQGYVAETWRFHRGRRLGPYYQLRYREQHCARSLYLGRDPALTEQVRERLRHMQATRRVMREAKKEWQRERATLRQLLAPARAELRRIGLWMKGFEIRGPVRACLRAYFAQASFDFTPPAWAAYAAPDPLDVKRPQVVDCGKTPIWCPNGGAESPPQAPDERPHSADCGKAAIGCPKTALQPAGKPQRRLSDARKKPIPERQHDASRFNRCFAGSDDPAQVVLRTRIVESTWQRAPPVRPFWRLTFTSYQWQRRSYLAVIASA
jgi:hypothetical protein